jgi:hypothetical protein
MIPDSVAAAAAKKVFDLAAPKALSAIAKKAGMTIDTLRVKYTKTFQEHVERTYARISYVKTVVSKDQPVRLSDIYVSLDLVSDGQRTPDSKLVDFAQQGCRVFIYGTGGAGKTMMVKYLLLTMIGNPLGLVPVFIEFRNLNIADHVTLEAAIYSHIASESPVEDFSLFKAGLEEGLFFITLDGLDEIPSSSRSDILQKVNRFCSKYTKTSLIMSSRPGYSPQNLELFTAYEVAGLTKEQAVMVVERTPCDSDLKVAFIDRIQNELYEREQEFLKVPLLVVMMLLTFSSYSDVPERMTVFYEQAFETLYALHDTNSKGPFKRQHYAGLSPDLFRHFFETFCFITISRERYDFIYSELIEYIQKSLQLNQLTCTPEDLQKDLEESVCLVVQDGVKYVFVHRSFQEYFSAKFALRYGGENQYDILNKCIGTGWQNNTINMLAEIDALKFREKWLLPALKNLLQYLRAAKRKGTDHFLGDILSSIRFSVTRGENGYQIESGGYTLGRNREIARLSVLIARTSDLINFFSYLSSSFVIDKLFHAIRELEDEFDGIPPELKQSVSVTGTRNKKGGRTHYAVQPTKASISLLESAGLPLILDEYYAKVSSELKRVEKLVREQKKLEVKIL